MAQNQTYVSPQYATIPAALASAGMSSATIGGQTYTAAPATPITYQSQQISSALDTRTAQSTGATTQANLPVIPQTMATQKPVVPGQPQQTPQLTPDQQASQQAIQNAQTLNASKVNQQSQRAFQLAQQAKVPAPTGPGAGMAGVSQFQGAVLPAQQEDPVVAGAMADYQQAVANQNAYQPTIDLVQHYHDQMAEALGVPKLQADLLSLNTIMNGTEQDVRNEISATGGTATESQVEAIAYARNKVLSKQATNIQNSLTLAESKLNTLTTAFSSDQQALMENLKNKVTSSYQYTQLLQNMTTKAQGNYDKIVANVGYNGLANALDDTGKRSAERALGFPSGALSNPQWLQSMETNRQKQLQLSMASLGLRTQTVDAMTLSRYQTAINNVLKQVYPSNKTPLQNYNLSAQSMARINAALPISLDPSNKNKAASDLDLIDSYVSIARGGQQITEAQVDTLLSGLGIKAKFDVATQKITGTSILDNGTRQSIANLSQEIFTNQKKLADQSVKTINDRLSKVGIPSQYLFNSPEEVTFGDGGASQYQAGTRLQVGNTFITAQQDGTFIGDNGTVYDSEGKVISK